MHHGRSCSINFLRCEMTRKWGFLWKGYHSSHNSKLDEINYKCSLYTKDARSGINGWKTYRKWMTIEYLKLQWYIRLRTMECGTPGKRWTNQWNRNRQYCLLRGVKTKKIHTLEGHLWEYMFSNVFIVFSSTTITEVLHMPTD